MSGDNLDVRDPQLIFLKNDFLDLAEAAAGNGEHVVIDLAEEERRAAAAAVRSSETAAVGGLLVASRPQLALKRTMDVALSLAVAVLLLPVLLLTALAVGLSSRGPVFYVQERVGRDGSRFKMLKFRSMYADAHERRAQFEGLNEATGPVFKVKRDPRITPIGRVIRKLSIDELPQLWNVLRGDMSLVGPRPPLPEEYATYGAKQRRRLLVTPGLTCIWQVSGRSNVGFDEWIDMDIEYIRTWTPVLDVMLLVRTIPAVLTGRGAY